MLVILSGLPGVGKATIVATLTLEIASRAHIISLRNMCEFPVRPFAAIFRAHDALLTSNNCVTT